MSTDELLVLLALTLPSLLALLVLLKLIHISGASAGGTSMPNTSTQLVNHFHSCHTPVLKE
jgi:hypothetical protein